nr:hypothetical protein [Desulfobulbaceae bacterium]
MIPEKIGQAQTPPGTSQPAKEVNRTYSLSISEGGKVVGKFIYDRLSAAVSLIHELKVLAAIKFTQLEITDESVRTGSDSSVQGTDVIDTLQSGQLSSRDQIRKILRHHLDESRQVQMPCALIMMMASLETVSTVPVDTILFEITSIIGEIKEPQGHLLWYPLQGADLAPECYNGLKMSCLSTGFCLILPAAGLIKARLLVDEIKKKLDGPDWSYCPISLAAGIGVKTTSDITVDELIEKVTDNLKKSITQGGKQICFTDTFSSSQVTVEERAQLFMISKKALN